MPYSSYTPVPATIPSLYAYIFISVGSALLLNGLIFGAGLAQEVDTTADIAFAPPGWVIGAVWTGLFALFGTALWRLRSKQVNAQSSLEYNKTANWLFGFILWCLLYPVTSGGFDPMQGQLVNIVSLLFGALVISRVWRTDRNAGWLLVPALFWMCFAVLLGSAILLESRHTFS